MTTTTECTCADYDPEVYDDCGCRRCPEVARGTAGCPHRLERIMDEQGGTVGRYGGMCDRCFEDARDVRGCGLRVAEHAP